MSYLGFPLSPIVAGLRRHVKDCAKAEGLENSVAVVQVYVYRAFGDNGPRSYSADFARGTNSEDRAFGDGWGINVEHHNESTAAALGRHIMFISDAHYEEDPELELNAAAAAICQFAAGKIIHDPPQ